MEAYAVLAGGGIKGAALAGCLSAAQSLNIKFIGYAGSSAGAMVGLLATAGYSGDEIGNLLMGWDPTNAFEDGGGSLHGIREIGSTVRGARLGWLRLAFSIMRHNRLIRRLEQDFGMYDTARVKMFLESCLKDKRLDRIDGSPLSFADLAKLDYPTLKVIASDIGLRRPIIYSASSTGGSEVTGNVLDAVCASISHPFVFKPTKYYERHLVDGGLCTNLPIYAFDREQQDSGLPIIAFDLVHSAAVRTEQYKLPNFVSDLLLTALESTDAVSRVLMSGCVVVRVEVPASISTLDFHINKEGLESLYNAGYRATHQKLAPFVQRWSTSTTGTRFFSDIPVQHLLTMLRGVSRDFERASGSSQAASILFRRVSGDSFESVCADGASQQKHKLSGDHPLAASWRKRRPLWLRDRSGTRFEWLTPDSKAAMILPLFDLSRAAFATSAADLDVLGLVVVAVPNTISDETMDTVLNTIKPWADLLSRLIA